MIQALLLMLTLPAVECSSIVPSHGDVEALIRWQPRLIVEFHSCERNERRYVVATASNASWDVVTIKTRDFYVSSAPRTTFHDLRVLADARPLLSPATICKEGGVARLGPAQTALIFGPELPPNARVPASVAIHVAVSLGPENLFPPLPAATVLRLCFGDWSKTVLRDEDGQRERVFIH